MPVQETSLAAYRALQPTLTKRQNAVLRTLQGYTRHRVWPTAYELYDEMKTLGLVHDLNDVRPRLTELQGKGLIQAFAKRPCRITKKRAFVWRVVEAGQGQLF